MKSEKEKLEHLQGLICKESWCLDLGRSYDEESTMEEFGTFLKALPVDLVDNHLKLCYKIFQKICTRKKLIMKSQNY